MSKHFTHTIEHGKFSWSRRVEAVEQEAKLDGIYVRRTSERAEQLSAADTAERQVFRMRPAFLSRYKLMNNGQPQAILRLIEKSFDVAQTWDRDNIDSSGKSSVVEP